MKKINRVFILAFIILMFAAIIGAVAFEKNHQWAIAIICAVMVWTLKSDKADFQVKEEEEN